MKRTILALLAVLVLGAVGVTVWFFATTGIDEDTAQVTAPTLAASVSTTAGSVTTAGSESSAVEFALSEGSTVRFELDEELRGAPKHVVATNSEVAGLFRLDLADLAQSEIGVIVVGAQTFETDSSNRNRAIRGPILDASTFPEIRFVPTAVSGLTGAAAAGQELSFTVTGDLTIRDVTASVTFEVTATLVADDQITGTASTQVLRSDFGLQIPSVQSVANVTDEVMIFIDFTAIPAVP